MGTFAFAVIMRAQKNHLLYIVIGGTISAGALAISEHYLGEIMSNMLSMLLIVFYSEKMARLLKTPSTVILMPSTIPLLPGSSIYYTMLYAVHGKSDEFLSYAKSTVSVGLGIALGAIVGEIIIKMIFLLKRS